MENSKFFRGGTVKSCAKLYRRPIKPFRVLDSNSSSSRGGLVSANWPYAECPRSSRKSSAVEVKTDFAFAAAGYASSKRRRGAPH